MRPSLRRSLIAAGLVSIAALLPAAPAAAQSPVVCPATFHVLHDDSIGDLELPAGNYQVTVRGGLSCPASSEWLARFLEDFNGVLPRPWRLDSDSASFSRGASAVGFGVARVATPSGGGSGGRHPLSGRLCPGTFRVLNNDRIGSLRLPRGNYTITALSLNRPTCSRASRLFTRFLNDFTGDLPGRWSLDPQTATFRRGAASFGFRVKPVSD
ncbi:MAG TPA: hypothetical protein VHF88_09960 [Thermoleophilaceae bacterium]|nr:hypothetical protein [Thermoleophilaceae bacterium]